MPYITSFERDAKLEIARESVIAVLETRFSALPDALIQRINSGKDIDLLKQLLVSAVTINSVEEFGQMLTETQGE